MPENMKLIEEIVIVPEIIQIENTIALSDRSLETENSFDNDAPCIMAQLSGYINDDYSTFYANPHRMSTHIGVEYKAVKLFDKNNVMYQNQKITKTSERETHITTSCLPIS